MRHYVCSYFRPGARGLTRRATKLSILRGNQTPKRDKTAISACRDALRHFARCRNTALPVRRCVFFNRG
ncbi:hypothetical protein BGLT_07388 [Caballeronia glathei]|nr:hypothetical protein BGLT_07388 [Caballeronia glathei]